MTFQAGRDMTVRDVIGVTTIDSHDRYTDSQRGASNFNLGSQVVDMSTENQTMPQHRVANSGKNLQESERPCIPDSNPFDLPATHEPLLPLIRTGNPASEAYALALVINIYHYDHNDPSQDISRIGSDLDVQRCVATFTRFGVGVFLPQATKETRILHKDISRWIEEFKAKFIKGVTQACFVVIMGHGDKPGLLGDSSNDYRDMQESIFDAFNNQNFKTMIDRPKLFFMNCCRGDTEARLVERDLKPINDEDGDPTFDGKAVHVSDILIFWSTTPGNQAMRNKQEGTVFINHLFSRFDNYANYLEGGAVRGNCEIRRILRDVANTMQGQVHRVRNAELSQTTNIDDRHFHDFYWLLGDCKYETFEGLPF